MAVYRRFTRGELIVNFRMRFGLTRRFVYSRGRQTFTDGHVAFRALKDFAFTSMKSGADIDAFEASYEEAKGKLAKEVYQKNPKMLHLLLSMALRLKEEGVQVCLFLFLFIFEKIILIFVRDMGNWTESMFCLQVLAQDDAKTFKTSGAALPTFHDMNAGTFARALTSADGRKGALKVAEMTADYRNPDVVQPASVVKKVELILTGTGGLTSKEHRDASEAGGASPLGGWTDPNDKKNHVDASEAGGASPSEAGPTPTTRKITSTRP